MKHTSGYRTVISRRISEMMPATKKERIQRGWAAPPVHLMVKALRKDDLEGYSAQEIAVAFVEIMKDEELPINAKVRVDPWECAKAVMARVKGIPYEHKTDPGASMEMLGYGKGSKSIACAVLRDEAEQSTDTKFEFSSPADQSKLELDPDMAALVAELRPFPRAGRVIGFFYEVKRLTHYFGSLQKRPVKKQKIRSGPAFLEFDLESRILTYRRRDLVAELKSLNLKLTQFRHLEIDGLKAFFLRIGQVQRVGSKMKNEVLYWHVHPPPAEPTTKKMKFTGEFTPDYK